MVNDDERREVARRLRELHPEDRSWWGIHGFDWYMFADYLLEAIGFDKGGWGGWTERLADLIEPGEPSGHECVPGECPLNASRDSDFIDRDALLALADEMQRELDECASDHEIVGNLQSQIDRIRDALGVSDD